MKFGIFYEHQLPRPWEPGAELRLFQHALDQVELADRQRLAGWSASQLPYSVQRAGEAVRVVVGDDQVIAVAQQLGAGMRADEAGAAGHQDYQ